MDYGYRINIFKYIFISFIVGSLIYVLINENKWLASFIASCFFIFLVIREGKALGIIIFLFLFIPIINSYNYYNLEVSGEINIRLTKIYSYGGYGNYKGRLIYLENNLNEFSLGDKIKIKGEFKEGLNYEKGLIGSFSIEESEKMNNDLISKIYRLRQNIFTGIKEKIGTRRAAIITSISFGYTEMLDEEDTENMKNLGILHAVSVSGLHMVIIYSLLKKIAGENLARIVSGLYVIFTGAALSTIRSYIMLFITSLSKTVRRDYNPLGGLSLAGIIIILMRPNSIFDVGFQLSFLATLSIILFNKKLNRLLYKLPKYLRENLSICLSSQILTFPVLIITFKELSLGFILGNLLLIPIINAIVITGNILVLIFPFKSIFSYVIFINYYLTRILDSLTNILLNISIDTMNLNSNIAKFYILSLITFYFYKKGYKKSIYMLLIGVIYIFTSIYSIFPKITYLNEGAVFIHYKNNRSIFYIKKNVDEEKIRNITYANKEYRDFEKIIIRNNCYIERYNENLNLKTLKENYYLRISKEKIDKSYDIIDFKDGRYKKIIILKNKAFKIY